MKLTKFCIKQSKFFGTFLISIEFSRREDSLKKFFFVQNIVKNCSQLQEIMSDLQCGSPGFCQRRKHLSIVSVVSPIVYIFKWVFYYKLLPSPFFPIIAVELYGF